jgi:hypothetical protein
MLIRLGPPSETKLATLTYPRDAVRAFLQERDSDDTLAFETLAALAETVFFTSLIHDENESVKIAIVFHEGGASGLRAVLNSSRDAPPDDEEPAWDVTAIDARDFDPPTLAKLSKGLEYGRQSAVVGFCGGRLVIDGIARRLQTTNGGNVVRVAASRPGAFVVEYGASEWLRYEAGARMRPPFDVFDDDGPVLARLTEILSEPSASTPAFPRTSRVSAA